MAGIGVILNPYSKKYKNNPEKTKHMGFIVGDKASCKATEDLDDLKRVADEFKSRDIDILAISGGDGTIHCTLTTFIQVYGDKPLPKIALLRGGTINNIANCLGIKGSSETLLSSLMVKYHEDIPFDSVKLQITQINEDYGFLFGIGLVQRFMELYYKRGNPSPLHALGTLSQATFSALFNGKTAQELFRRFDAEVYVDGKRWPFANYSSLFSGSVIEMGLKFKVFYLMKNHPTSFHAVGFSMPPRSFLKLLPSMFLGKSSGSEDLLEAPAKEMTIKLKEPMTYNVDGDIKAPKDYFHLKVGPQLTILLP